MKGADIEWQARTRRSYDAVARAYAQQVGPLAASDNEMASEFDDLVTQARGGRPAGPVIADIGCGPGWWSHRMATSGARVVGIDVSPLMAGIARAEAPPPTGRADFVAGSATALPLDDAACDGLALWYVLHHLNDGEVLAALGEARRVCRRGGVILLGGHVGEGVRIKREGYGLPMVVLVAKRAPAWWEAVTREAGFDVFSHEVGEGGGHHVLRARAV